MNNNPFYDAAGARFLFGRVRNELGVATWAYHQAALAHLASTMSAAIVADLLGVSVRSATKWAQLVGRDWSDYLDQR